MSSSISVGEFNRSEQRPERIFVTPTMIWIVAILGCAVLGIIFQRALVDLVNVWFKEEEFSYGPLLPFVCGFLVWQQKDEIQKLEFTGSWAGVVLFLFAMLLALAGELAAIPTLVQYGLVFAIAGLTLATTGWQVFRRLLAPLFILLLAIPLPGFFVNNLSSELQLLSSTIGVAVIRMFGISVFLEGNVIDLGVYKLQVAEACDGLRYLFPLITLSFIMAYFYKVAMWKRVLLFLSSIPITILMNSFRIGTIGIMVEHWGVRMAEGFLHEFQGWMVFMVSAALLLGEMVLLARIGRDRRPWREVFGVEFPALTPAGAERRKRQVPGSLVATACVLVVCAATMAIAPERAEAVPQREPFATFPQQMDEWQGRKSALEQIYLDALKLDDYIMSDFISERSGHVNLYVAWYDSQRAGRAAHSPRSCLPGGGWRIDDLSQTDVPGVAVGGNPLRVNRALISHGDNKQVVYYWFQQRGRIVNNEYLVKWFLFVDSLTRQRTDGALVRLISAVRPGETTEQAEQRLGKFAATIAPSLERHIPG